MSEANRRSKNITATNPTTNAAGTSQDAWAIAVENLSSTWGGSVPLPAASPALAGSNCRPCAARRESISTATAAEPSTEAT